MANESNEIRLKNDAVRQDELPRYSEYAEPREFTNVSETKRIAEIPESRAERAKPAKRKTTRWQRILIAAVATVAVVAFDLVGLSPPSGASVRSYSIEASDTSVFYWIEFDNYTSGDDLSVEVYNDFFRYRQEVEDHSVSGDVFDLKPNMTYTVDVRSGNSILLRKKVTTQESQIEPEPYEEPTPVEEPDQTEEPYEESESTDPEPNLVQDHGFEVGGTGVSFWIELNEEYYTQAQGNILSVKAYNPSEPSEEYEQEVEVEEQVVYGEIGDLQYETTYIIEIRNGDTLLISEEVTTETADGAEQGSDGSNENNSTNGDPTGTNG